MLISPMVTSNYHCQSPMLSKDVISDVMGSDSKDSEDLNEDVVTVEGDTDSDSACKLEAIQSHGAHMLPTRVSRMEQIALIFACIQVISSSSSSSTVTIVSNPFTLCVVYKGHLYWNR